MKTKHQIIDETVRYIKRYGRSNDRNGCLYISYKNDCAVGCAVGRVLKAEVIRRLEGDIDLNGSDLEMLTDELGDLDSILKPSYRGHEERFWSALQGLHDEDIHWCGDKLSVTGEGYLENLKIKYEN